MEDRLIVLLQCMHVKGIMSGLMIINYGDVEMKKSEGGKGLN